MEKFVDKVAHYLISSEIPLQHWVIVLPSERATSYLQKALYEQIGNAFFAPNTLTINRWLGSLSQKTILDQTRLLILLYDIHLKYPDKTIDSSFDEFLNWGNTLLSDFDELERYMVDSKLLFRNLRDIKEIENWSFGEDKELTENQKKYLAFWERLPFYYKEFKQKLVDKNATYIGAVYRGVAENIDLAFQKNKDTHYLFAGFNALSEAELSIFRQLHRLGRGHILIDGDEFYMQDTNHEAGMFLRKLKSFIQEKSLPFVTNKLLNETKKIEVISCAQMTGQIKVVSTKLASLTTEEINETMVLLADESLIIPLFQNIPKTVQKANITLGLPLSSTALKTWLELIFSIQEGKLKYKRDTIYYKDLLAIWNHPFFQEILDENEKKLIYKKEKVIHSKNMIFQSLKSIQMSEKIDALMELLFSQWHNSWKTAIEAIRSANQFVFSHLPKESEFERAILLNFDKSIIDFHNCVMEGLPEMNLRSFKVLFNQTWSKQSIAYYGNPLDGLQIMGLLETRLLDFKRILVVGMNEGKMPPSNPIQSLIPMDLRKFVGMPTPREKQGLFAHHFYRLLHHCEEMLITYHNGAEGFTLSEKSRFIAQLELEMIPLNPKIEFTKRDYELNQQQNNPKEKSVLKTPEVLLQLDEFCTKGVSASKLKTYFSCPLDFYYKYILNFGEDDKVEEEVESNTFGTLIHHVLEELYKPFSKQHQNKEILLTVKHLEQMFKDFKPLLFQAFKEHFNGDEQAFLVGKNYLSFEMANELTAQFLRSELHLLKENPTKKLVIISLEENLTADLELKIHGETKKIHLKGFIDRIDLWDNEFRIIDYKSGVVHEVDVAKSSSNKTLELSELLALIKKSKHIFQLMTYVYLFKQNYQHLPHQSAIYSFITTKNNPYVMEIGGYSYEQLVELYPTLLQHILEEIYDADVPFIHDAKALYCGYC
jgi:ATP-dependent helicase/nuclease subunit B